MATVDIEIGEITESSIEARVINLETGMYKEVYWYLDGDEIDNETVAARNTESSWITFDGLDPGTEYLITADVYYGEDWIGSPEVYETTAGGGYEPDMSGVYIQERTPDDPETEIAVRLNGLDTEYTEGDWSVYWYLHDHSLSGSSQIDGTNDTVSAGDSRSSTVTFSGLESGHTYEVQCRIVYYVDGTRNTKWYYLDVTTSSSGGSTSGDWTIMYENSYSNISDTLALEYGLQAGEVARVRVYFSESGTAEFYSEGDGDTVGYLSDQDSDYFDTSSGTPNSILTSDDDSGTDSNFSFTYDVEAGTYYYLYVRHYSLTASGTPTVYIVPPGSSVDMGLADIVAESSASGTEITAYVDGLGTGYDDGAASIRWYIGAVSDSSYFGETLVYDTTSSDSFTFEGLTADTQYTLYAVIVYYVNGTEYSKTIYKDVTTNESVTIDGAYVEFGSNTGTTITVSIKGLDTSYGRNDRYIYWSVDGVEQSPVSLSSGVSQSNSYTFTGLSPSTSYTIGARITYTSNGTTLSKELEDISCSTANWASSQQSGLGTVSSEKTASWTLQKATLSYASVKFSQSGNVTISSSGSYDTYGYLTTGTPGFDNSTGVPNNYVAYDDDDGDSSNFSITYAVEAGVTYYIWVRGYSTSTTVGAITLNVNFSNRPELFTWDDGSTVKNSGEEFDITASEWCALLDNINAVRVYKGYSQIQTGTTAAYFTYPNSGDEFTAIHYNQALNGITGMLGSGYSDNAVSSGDEITAAKINLLVEWLNDIE